MFKHLAKSRRGQLLGRIAPGIIGVNVRFNNQTVVVEVHRHLRQFVQIGPLTGHVARIANDGQFRENGLQFDSHLPHRNVAVLAGFSGSKPPVNGTQFGDTGSGDALKGTHPQGQVGVHGVFNQHRHINTTQRIGNFLHVEGVYGGAGTNPQNIDTIFQGQFDVLGRGNLHRERQTRFGFGPLNPGKGFFAHTLKTTRTGAGLPNARTNNMNRIQFFQLTGGLHKLIFGLRATRPGNNQRLSVGLNPR